MIGLTRVCGLVVCTCAALLNLLVDFPLFPLPVLLLLPFDDCETCNDVEEEDEEEDT